LTDVSGSKPAEENLKSRPKQFWKHAPQFRTKNADLMLVHFRIDGVSLSKSREFSDTFSKRF
jgi:phosphotransferase system IIA component